MAETGTMHDALIDQIEGVNHMMPLENFPALTTNLVNMQLMLSFQKMWSLKHCANQSH